MPLTYRQYLDTLKQDAQRRPSNLVAANMLAATMAMQWAGGNGELDQKAVTTTAQKLIKRPAFKELMADENAVRMMQEGKTLELVDLLAKKESSFDRYARKQENAKQDADFLKDASEAMQAAGGAAALQRKDRRFTEMMKQIEHARSLSEKGIPLSGADTKALVNAVKAYNDGGTDKVGGNKKAPAFKESMCVLKQFMPQNEYEEYVNSFNAAHPKRQVKAENFTREMMTGKVKSAREIRTECMISLQKRFNEEDCAKLLAVQNLAKRDPNKLITPKELENETKRLLGPGTALRRTVTNERDRRDLMRTIAEGKVGQVTKQLSERAKGHAIGAAQWRLNQSAQALNEQRLNEYNASRHLANILVAHEFASKVDPAHKITNKVFNQSVEEMQSDPSFQRLVKRYCTDAQFRNRMNKDVMLDGGGSMVALEYHRIEQSGRRRVREQPERQQDQPERRQEQPERQRQPDQRGPEQAQNRPAAQREQAPERVRQNEEPQQPQLQPAGPQA